MNLCRMCLNNMHTIPLYTLPADENAWHRVRAPGGYEWWHFDAEDPQHDRRLIATFYDGYIFDAEYQRRYSRYLRRPTRNVPPLPGEFPCVHFALYEADRVRANFTTKFPSSEFSASDEMPLVTIGANRAELIGGEWKISISSQECSAEIGFSPFFGPFYEARATIGLNGETIEFRGRGYHDHQFATSPPGNSLSGRVLFDDAACAFHISSSAILIEADASGAREIVVENFRCEEDFSAIACDEVLKLSDPKILLPREAIYDAIWRGRKGKAFCTIIQNDTKSAERAL
jgi:hypothetical protein